MFVDAVRLDDVDVGQTGLAEVALVFVAGERSSDAADVLLHVGARGLVHAGIGDDVRDGEPPAGLEHAQHLAQRRLDVRDVVDALNAAAFGPITDNEVG